MCVAFIIFFSINPKKSPNNVEFYERILLNNDYLIFDAIAIAIPVRAIIMPESVSEFVKESVIGIDYYSVGKVQWYESPRTDTNFGQHNATKDAPRQFLAGACSLVFETCKINHDCNFD